MNRVRIAALAAVGLVVGTSPWWLPAALRPLAFFAVRRVEVHGVRYLAPDVVVAALGLGPEASVFDDRDALAERVRAMGGVVEAVVGRRLPGTLIVQVREAEPIALAQGPEGLVPVDRAGRPLPYDVTRSPVDAPVVADADRRLTEALGTIQTTDAGLYAEIASARARGKEVVLDVTQGRIRFELPVDPAVVRAVSAVRRDLAARALAWRELDGRFHRWVVVRKAA